MQIAIAAGHRLPFAWESITPRGHAMEVRIYAEDPDNNFFPCPGKIVARRIATGPGIRLDEGVYRGWTVPMEYDPLLSKLIAWGNSREETIARLRRALDEYTITGIRTNVSLFRRILTEPEFLSGEIHTKWLDQLLARPRPPAVPPRPGHGTSRRDRRRLLGKPATGQFFHRRPIRAARFVALETRGTPRATRSPAMKFEVHLDSVAGKTKHVVELQKDGASYKVSLDGVLVDADVILAAPHAVSVILNGAAFEIQIAPSLDGAYKLQTGPHEFQAEVRDLRAWHGRKHGALEVEGRQQILAPMPGKVIRLLVKVGDEVEAGQGLVVVEAMKMQNEIRSPKKGKVERLQAKEGQPVNAGDVLAWVE